MIVSYTIRSLLPGISLSRKRIAWELGYLMENYPNFIWMVHYRARDMLTLKAYVPLETKWNHSTTRRNLGS